MIEKDIYLICLIMMGLLLLEKLFLEQRQISLLNGLPIVMKALTAKVRKKRIRFLRVHLLIISKYEPSKDYSKSMHIYFEDCMILHEK